MIKVILSFSFILLLPQYASVAALVGIWSPITDVKDPHVVEIGKFAVSEYDKQTKSGLTFVSVVRGETQVVSGKNYRLVVSVNDGSGVSDAGGNKNYEAIVWEKSWPKSRNLISFKPVNNGRFL